MYGGRLLFGKAPRLASLRSQVASYAKSAKEEQAAFWKKNAGNNRPMSPHLTIYRLPLPAMMSVMHRGTGAAISGVCIGFGLGSLFWSGNFQKVVDFLQYNIHPHVFLTLKGLLALSFTYHTVHGVRHLIWDTGRSLTLPIVYKQAYLAIGLVALMTLALTLVG